MNTINNSAALSRLTRCWLSLALLLTFVLAICLPPTYAAGSTNRVAQPTNQVTQAQPQMSLSWLGAATVTESNSVTLQIRLTATDGKLPEVDRFQLRWRSMPLRTRNALDKWESGQLKALSSIQAVTGEVQPESSDAVKVVNFTFTADKLALTDKNFKTGVFGISALAFGKGTIVARARTFLMWRHSETTATTTPLTVIAPITGAQPSMLHGVHTFANVAKALEPNGLLTTQTAVASIPGTTWALDPALMSPRMSAPGSGPPAGVSRHNNNSTPQPAAPPSETENRVLVWQQSLVDKSANHEVVILPWLDPDLATTARNGDGSVLRHPKIKDHKNESIRELRNTRSDVYWPALGRISKQDLPKLNLQPKDHIILGSDVYQNQDPDLAYPVSRSPLTGTAATALINDTTLSQQLNLLSATTHRPKNEPKTAQTPTSGSVAARILAEIAVHTLQDPLHPRARILSIDRDWHPSPEVGTDVIRRITSSPWTTTKGIDTLSKSAEPSAQRAFVAAPDQTVIPKHPYDSETVNHLKKNVLTISDAIDPSIGLKETVIGSELAALSSSWRGKYKEWSTQLGPWATWAEGIRHGVQVSQSSTINVVAFETAIPVTVTNSLTVPVTVSVLLNPSNKRLVPETSQQQTIPPDSRIVIQVPGRAVADGNASVIAEVLTPDSKKIASGKPFDIRIRRTWEGRAIMILGAILLLVIFFGVTRSIRKKRGHTPTKPQHTSPKSAAEKTIPDENTGQKTTGQKTTSPIQYPQSKSSS